MSHISQDCALQCPEGGHALVLLDTTEVNYHSHNGRFKINDADLGVLSNNTNTSTGLLLHAGLVVEAQSQLPIGLSSVHVWHRAFERPAKSKLEREMQPLEEKESYRWLETVHQSSTCLQKASQVTVIADRESDIYELFGSLPDERTHILVRSNTDRLTASGEKLSTCLAKQAWQGQKHISVQGNPHRPTREASLQVRWTQIGLAPPAKRKSLLKDYPQALKVWAVELLETPDSVPQGEEAVHWRSPPGRLLTTHPVACLTEALQIADWYALRWLIEELFHILKSKGMQVEESLFETGAALKKLLVLSLASSWKILLMKQERKGQNNLAASVCFQAEEITLLKALQPALEGSTRKQQNPHQGETLAWAAWLIARLGGWKLADLDIRPFGVIALVRGMKAFKQQWQGWRAAKEYMQNFHTFPTARRPLNPWKTYR